MQLLVTRSKISQVVAYKRELNRQGQGLPLGYHISINIAKKFLHLIIVIISDFRCQEPIKGHHDSNKQKMRPIKIFTAVIKCLRIAAFCFHKSNQTKKPGRKKNKLNVNIYNKTQQKPKKPKPVAAVRTTYSAFHPRVFYNKCDKLGRR